MTCLLYLLILYWIPTAEIDFTRIDFVISFFTIPVAILIGLHGMGEEESRIKDIAEVNDILHQPALQAQLSKPINNE